MSETETKRGRGRPASFPGVETVAILANIPTVQRDQLRELASKRGKAINVMLATLVERAWKDAGRRRKAK